MKHHSVSPERTQVAIAAFLKAHYAETHSNDIGPLLGLLSLLRNDAPANKTAQRQWNEAVSLALTGYSTARPH